MDEHLCGGDVGGQRDVVHITQAQQGHLIGLAGLCIDGVAEEQQQIDLIAGDAGRDLLVAALDARQEPLHLQARGLGDHLAGRTGGHQFMLAQDPAVCRTELNHQLLFGVMRDQCNRHRSTSPLRSPCAGPFPCTYHSIIISLFLQQVFGQKRRFFREFLQFPPKSAHYRHAPAVAAASAGAAAASFCPASSVSPAAGSAVPSAGASAASAAVSGCASDSAAASSTVRVPSFIA